VLKLVSEIRIWQWPLGLTVVHLAATAPLIGLNEYLPAAFHANTIIGVYDRDLLEVASELLRTSLTLLHLPIMAVEDWLPLTAPPPPAVLWIILGADALLQSLIIATGLRWLIRPPQFFTVHRVPFVTRSTVLLCLALAMCHVGCSAILYLMARLGGRSLASTARDAWDVLHPMVGGGVFQSHGLARVENLSLLFLEALVWAFVTTALIVLVQRVFFSRNDKAVAAAG